jgi:hypothetical protein
LKYSLTNGAQTTGLVLNALIHNKATVAWPAVAGGILRFSLSGFEEYVGYASATLDTANTVTLVDVTRDLPWNDGTSYTTAGGGKAWPAGTVVELVLDARHMNKIAFQDLANTFSAKQTMSAGLALTGTTGTLTLPTFTTTQRNALTPAEGMMIKNSTTGLIEGYVGGVWVSITGGSIADATTSTAGKVTLAQQSDVTAKTAGKVMTTDLFFGGLNYTATKTADYTAAAGERVLCDSSAGPFVVTLPASPTENSVIGVVAETVGSGTVPLGYASVGGSTDNNGGGNTILAIGPITSTFTGSVTSIKIYIRSGTGNGVSVTGAIYTDNAGGGPNTLVCNSAAATTSGTGTWLSLPVSSGSLTAGSKYWIAFNADGAINTNTATDAAYSIVYKASTYSAGNLPASFPSSPTVVASSAISLSLTVSTAVVISGNGKNINATPTKTLSTTGDYYEMSYNGTRWDVTSYAHGA